MKSIAPSTLWLLCWTAILLSLPIPPACAQSTNENNFDTTHVPSSATAVAVFSPKQLIEADAFELLPTEIIRVAGQEQFGIDPLDVSEVRLVVSLGPQQPRFGAMITGGKVDLERLVTAFGGPDERFLVREIKVYPIDGPPGTVAARVDQETIYIGNKEQFIPMLDATTDDGPLPSLLATMPRKPGLNVAMTMEQIGPMVDAVAVQQAAYLAPELQPLGEIPGLTDGVLSNIQFDGKTGSIELSLIGKDNAAAKRIQTILSDAITAARSLGIAEISRTLSRSQQSPQMRQAIESYAVRVADRLVKDLTPHRSEQSVTLAVESEVGLLSMSLVAGSMAPAIPSIRIEPTRMKSSNNMKQIMLAFHNYHSSYRELPVSAITDGNGKPLLSWRVAILPFIEQQPLYNQFHLDEPWDSEHNLPLSKQLPAVYRSPGKRLAPGMTTYQASVGKAQAFKPLEATKFRDCLDGLSNTIFLLEVNDEAAVPWSKPADLEIDMDDPLAKLGAAQENGFHVGLGDGAVVFLTNQINPDLFKALLTRNGKEVIEETLRP